MSDVRTTSLALTAQLRQFIGNCQNHHARVPTLVRGIRGEVGNTAIVCYPADRPMMMRCVGTTLQRLRDEIRNLTNVVTNDVNFFTLQRLLAGECRSSSRSTATIDMPAGPSNNNDVHPGPCIVHIINDVTELATLLARDGKAALLQRFVEAISVGGILADDHHGIHIVICAVASRRCDAMSVATARPLLTKILPNDFPQCLGAGAIVFPVLDPSSSHPGGEVDQGSVLGTSVGVSEVFSSIPAHLILASSFFGNETTVRRCEELIEQHARFYEAGVRALSGLSADGVASTGALIRSVPPTTGVLLTGPSGCGKTTLAHCLANCQQWRQRVNFIAVSAGRLFSKYLGETEERLRAVFAAARQRKPSVLIIDELDIIGRRRKNVGSSSGASGGADVTRRLLSALLIEMDGFAENEGVLVLGTTNQLDALDSALLRKGRIETVLTLSADPFTASSLAAALQRTLRGVGSGAKATGPQSEVKWVVDPAFDVDEAILGMKPVHPRDYNMLLLQLWKAVSVEHGRPLLPLTNDVFRQATSSWR